MKEIINILTEDSCLTYCWRQFNSIISEDFNDDNAHLDRKNVFEKIHLTYFLQLTINL